MKKINKKTELSAGFGSRKKAAKRELFCIIGLGRFGMALAESLSAEGKELIVIDSDRDKVNYAAQFCENAFVLDSLSRENLEKVGVGECDTVIVGIGRKLDISVLTVLNLKNMGVERVIAKSTSTEQGMVLEKLGAEVVYPEKDMGERLAARLARPNVLEYLSLGQDVDIVELCVGSRADGKKVAELDLRRRFSLNMIAIKKDGAVSADIGPDTVVSLGDRITVIGRAENIDKLAEWLEK